MKFRLGKLVFLAALVGMGGCGGGAGNLGPMQAQRVGEAQSYLDHMKKACGAFVQSGALGNGVGRYFYAPPALRLEYRIPRSALLVAHSNRAVMINRIQRTRTSQSLRGTPLTLLFENPPKITGPRVHIVDERDYPGGFQISLVPRGGNGSQLLTLQFQDYQVKTMRLIGIDARDKMGHVVAFRLDPARSCPRMGAGKWKFPS